LIAGTEPGATGPGPTGFAPIVAGPGAGPGRRYRGEARVRLADVDRTGRVRLDALARYLQDVGNDDAIDAIPGDAMNWVVRRTTVEVGRWAGFREDLTLTTWSSGAGGRWAERRTTITGDRGAHVEAAVLWIHVDPTSGRPLRLPASFAAAYGASHGGRTVTARTTHGEPPPEGPEARWVVRTADLDLVGHVNNAVYWQMVEEALPVAGAELPLLAEIEYRGGLDQGDEVTLGRRLEADGTASLWVRSAKGIAASARMKPNGYTG
jgi:acyl-ACP thioesterase